MASRTLIERCPLCGTELRAVEKREVYLNVQSMAFDPECGNLDFTGDGEEYKETAYITKGRVVRCENGHQEADIRNALEARTSVSR